MEYLKELEQKFEVLNKRFQDELAAIRTNRPTPKLVENIRAEYAGQALAINQLGSIGVEPPRNLVITPWSKDAAPSIVKAIESANIGVSVAHQGNVVRVILPELTEERRQELMKLVKSMAEQTRIKMRIERDEAQKIINKEPDKDQKFKAKEELQKRVDSFNQKIDSIIESKITEISS